MTKVKADETADGTSHKPAAKPAKPAGKRLHLLEIRSRQAEDGSIVHHHTYADSKDAKFPHPERQAAATSSSPEEAGQHIAEMFGQNGMSAGVNEEAEPAGQAAAPAAAAAPAQQQQAPPEE